jgi:RES domain-containing protein
MRVYRILRRRYSRHPFDGEGAYRFGGRWSSPGTRLAYSSEHLSLAMIEYFVHLDPDDAPKDLVLASAEVPDTLSRLRLGVGQLPAGRRRSPPPASLAALGDSFVREGRSAVLTVPSALAPDEWNLLLNPLHADFAKIKVLPVRTFHYDQRFFE